MTPPTNPLDALLHRHLHGELTDDEKATLAKALDQDPTLQQRLVEEALWETELAAALSESDAALAFSPPAQEPSRSRSNRLPWGIAAACALLLGASLWNRAPLPVVSLPVAQHPAAQGFAVIGPLLNPVPLPSQPPYRTGDTLGAERFSLSSGTAEILFFSGATMTVQGPAEIDLKSAWEAVCHEGVVRMQVPPAARGFKLHAPSTEIIDLGTEFALEVRNGEARVEVLDGEIAFRHNAGPQRHVTEGKAWRLPKGAAEVAEQTGTLSLPDIDHLDAVERDHVTADFERWQAHRDQLATDPRLIAYYTFDAQHLQSAINNCAANGSSEEQGTRILAQKVDGRWPDRKQALEFRRPGSRVRVHLAGEFKAFTFACWVRIDSLDRQYNALFMGDGYENGEPHWQIKDDGRMMLSVMVDDQRSIPKWPGSRFHKIYYSPPMWDLTNSGEWMHLASVYDPETRQVAHFQNGQEISRDTIPEEFRQPNLRIGNAEIGNWGQPFRTDPTWAIRNLNGRIDELALFNAALSAEDIATLYTRSRAEHR